MTLMLRKLLDIIDGYLVFYLVATPVLNLFSIVILITLHWVTGRFGYLISSFFLLLGLIILLSVIILNQKMKFNSISVLKIIVSIPLLYLVYVDMSFLIEAILNNGFIPCSLGASCP